MMHVIMLDICKIVFSEAQNALSHHGYDLPCLRVKTLLYAVMVCVEDFLRKM